MPDDWDSSPAWADARARTRAEVQAAFAPKEQTCPSCGRVEATSSRNCPHCGSSYVVVQPALSKRAKWSIAGGVVLLLLIASGVWALVSPSINKTKRNTAERAAAAKAEFIRSEKARLTADQRLHSAQGTTAGESQAVLVSDLQNAISADAHARVKAGTIKGPIESTSCEPVTFGPLVPNSARGGYECLVVTATIKPGVEVGGRIGYPFWAVVNYRRGTFTWCKVNPKPGEMATQTLEPVVNPPAGCDLHL